MCIPALQQADIFFFFWKLIQVVGKAVKFYFGFFTNKMFFLYNVPVHLFLKNMYFYAALDPVFDLMNPEALEKCKMISAINIKMESPANSERSWHTQKWFPATEEELSLSNKVCQGSDYTGKSMVL